MLKVLEALSGTPDRAQLLKSSEQLNEAQYKDEFEERLDVLRLSFETRGCCPWVYNQKTSSLMRISATNCAISVNESIL